MTHAGTHTRSGSTERLPNAVPVSRTGKETGKGTYVARPPYLLASFLPPSRGDTDDPPIPDRALVLGLLLDLPGLARRCGRHRRRRHQRRGFRHVEAAARGQDQRTRGEGPGSLGSRAFFSG